MKKYIITKSTDAYHASRMSITGKVLERDGATPVKWIHDDNCGYGFTIAEARNKLNDYYREDKNNWEGIGEHKYFELFYESDVVTYRAELADYYEVKDSESVNRVVYHGFSMNEAAEEFLSAEDEDSHFDIYCNGERVWCSRTDGTADAEEIMDKIVIGRGR